MVLFFYALKYKGQLDRNIRYPFITGMLLIIFSIFRLTNNVVGEIVVAMPLLILIFANLYWIKKIDKIPVNNCFDCIFQCL